MNFQRDLERVQRLFDGGAVSQEILDKARTAAGVADAAVAAAEERLALLEEGPRTERIAAQRAAVSQAEAAVDQIDATLTNAVVRVPFAGIITIRHREPGETVSPGLPVLTLMDPGDRWVQDLHPGGSDRGSEPWAEGLHLLRHLPGQEL